MRYTSLFGRTLREAPSGVEMIGHQLALRAGMMRSPAAGLHTYLPLGSMAINRLAGVVRQEWQAAGGQELMLSLAEPVQLLEQSGRYDELRADMARFRDQGNRELAVGTCQEEALLDLASSEIMSHHQLPVFLFQVDWRLSRGTARRTGLPGIVASRVAAGHSLHADDRDMIEFYERLAQAMETILQTCGMRPLRATASIGQAAATAAHCWVLAHESGPDDFVACTSCSYLATRASALMAEPEADESEPLPVQEVATPGAHTIAALAEYLGVPARSTLKVVFYTVKGRVVCVAIRGDRAVDETKLAQVLGDTGFYPSTEKELAGVGTVGGYGSPIGLRGARVIADRTVAAARNLVAGANKADYHLLNVNTPRDFTIDQVADLARVEQGDPCASCGGKLSLRTGISLARARTMGSSLSERLGADYLDGEGKARPLHLATYEVDLDRLLIAVMESHHDEHGIIWPAAVAPLEVYLLVLNLNKPDVAALAERLYGDLQAQGYRVLLDDRDASAGVKFNDADLIGLPLRVTVSARSLQQGGAEVKWRHKDGRTIVSLDALHLELRKLRPLLA